MKCTIPIGIVSVIVSMSLSVPAASALGPGAPNRAAFRHGARADGASLHEVHGDLVRARMELHLARADDVFRAAPEDEAARRAQVARELGKARVWFERALADVPEDEPQLSEGIRGALSELDVLAAAASAPDASKRFRALEQHMWWLMSIT